MAGQWSVVVVTRDHGDFIFIVSAGGKAEAERKGRELFRRGNHVPPGTPIKIIRVQRDGYK